MQTIFSIDGVTYNVEVKKLTRSFGIMDGQKAGRVLSGGMVRDIIGTYFNYELEIDTSNLDHAEYAELYDRLSAPQDSHLIEVPYNQSVQVFEAYVSSGSDSLKRKGVDGVWWEGLKIKFVAMDPQRRP